MMEQKIVNYYAVVFYNAHSFLLRLAPVLNREVPEVPGKPQENDVHATGIWIADHSPIVKSLQMVNVVHVPWYFQVTCTLKYCQHELLIKQVAGLLHLHSGIPPRFNYKSVSCGLCTLARDRQSVITKPYPYPLDSAGIN